MNSFTTSFDIKSDGIRVSPPPNQFLRSLRSQVLKEEESISLLQKKLKTSKIILTQQMTRP